MTRPSSSITLSSYARVEDAPSSTLDLIELPEISRWGAQILNGTGRLLDLEAWEGEIQFVPISAIVSKPLGFSAPIDPERRAELECNIKTNGATAPLLVAPFLNFREQKINFLIIDGESRFQVGSEFDLTQLPVQITCMSSEIQIYQRAMEVNRERLDSITIALLSKQLIALYERDHDMQKSEAIDHFKALLGYTSREAIFNILRIERVVTHPRLREMIARKYLSKSGALHVATFIAKHPDFDQAELTSILEPHIRTDKPLTRPAINKILEGCSPAGQVERAHQDISRLNSLLTQLERALETVLIPESRKAILRAFSERANSPSGRALSAFSIQVRAEGLAEDLRTFSDSLLTPSIHPPLIIPENAPSFVSQVDSFLTRVGSKFGPSKRRILEVMAKNSDKEAQYLTAYELAHYLNFEIEWIQNTLKSFISRDLASSGLKIDVNPKFEFIDEDNNVVKTKGYRLVWDLESDH